MTKDEKFSNLAHKVILSSDDEVSEHESEAEEEEEPAEAEEESDDQVGVLWNFSLKLTIWPNKLYCLALGGLFSLGQCLHVRPGT